MKCSSDRVLHCANIANSELDTKPVVEVEIGSS